MEMDDETEQIPMNGSVSEKPSKNGDVNGKLMTTVLQNPSGVVICRPTSPKDIPSHATSTNKVNGNFRLLDNPSKRLCEPLISNSISSKKRRQSKQKTFLRGHKVTSSCFLVLITCFIASISLLLSIFISPSTFFSQRSK